MHKLLSASLGRINQDDRDHMMNKRMDLAGTISVIFDFICF